MPKPSPNPFTFALAGLAMAFVLLVSGCGRGSVDDALESDANGFVCSDCKLKFYTAREVFPGHCPQCKQGNVQQVLGFVCPDDKVVTIAARGRGSLACQKCGRLTSAVSIPGEKELKAWGAIPKTRQEVGG